MKLPITPILGKQHAIRLVSFMRRDSFNLLYYLVVVLHVNLLTYIHITILIEILSLYCDGTNLIFIGVSRRYNP